MLHVPLTRRRGPGAGSLILVLLLVSAGCVAPSQPWPLQSQIDASQGGFPKLQAEGAGPQLALEARDAPTPIQPIHPIHLTATANEPLFLNDWYVEFGWGVLASQFGDTGEFLGEGSGMFFRAGWYGDEFTNDLGPNAAFEFGMEISDHRYSRTPGGEATHSRILAGLRLQDDRFPFLQPYMNLGVAFHSIVFDRLDTSNDIRGFGMYGGAGADFQLTPNLSLTFGVELHWWSGSDATGAEGEMGLLQVRTGLGLHF